MKKLFSYMLCVGLLMGSFVGGNEVLLEKASAATSPTITIEVDGKEVKSDVPPFISNGRVYVPVRVIGESLGAKVIGQKSEVTVEKGDRFIKMKLNSHYISINDQVYKIDSPVKYVKGRSFLPFRVMSDSLGFNIDWDNTAKKVIITTTTPPAKTTIEEVKYTDFDKMLKDNTLAYVKDTGFIASKALIKQYESSKEKNKEEFIKQASADILNFINYERKLNHLAPLTTNEKIQKVAETRAKEIATHYAHERPDKRSPFTVLGENGITYTIAGENIAAYQKNPIEVHNAWMKSEAHKENILNGKFTDVGIGVYIDKNGEVYWAESFVGNQ